MKSRRDRILPVLLLIAAILFGVNVKPYGLGAALEVSMIFLVPALVISFLVLRSGERN